MRYVDKHIIYEWVQFMVGVKRPNVLTAYVENQVAFLKIQFPDKSVEELTEFVKSTIHAKLKRPKTKLIYHPSPGNTEEKVVDLLSFIKQNNHRIFTPSGTIYKSTDEQVAFDKQFIDMLRNERDVSKQAMLRYKAENRKQESDLENFKQSLCKIRVNSIIGSNGNNQNAMYDREAFNGVTSMARHGVTMAYAFVERFLTSNFYFPDMESALNYVITTKKHCPPKEVINALLKKYNLVSPLPCEVVEMLTNSMKNYTSHIEAKGIQLNTILDQLPFHELAFVYYSKNLYNLFTMNTEVWTHWLYEFTHIHDTMLESDYLELDPDGLKKIDGDLKQVMATVYAGWLNGVQIKKCAEKDVTLAKKLVYIGNKMQEKLDDISDLFDTFLHNDSFISSIHLQKNILRKCVAISDTDSVIFTTRHLVEWSLGGRLNYLPAAYNTNAIIVYLLTKAISVAIKYMTIARGATGENVKMIEMKNEFLYPVLIKTNLGKHYAGDITIQEGNVLPKPELDIKGVSFMSSNVPQISHDFLKSFLRKIQSEFMEHQNIYVSDFIRMAYEYEQTIYTSLMSGEFTYFPNIGIRAKTEYKNPYSSIYQNYELWTDVFSDKYGVINIPSKVPLIPINKKLFHSDQYIDQLNMSSPIIYDKLQKYFDKLGKKKIGRIPISGTLTKVPTELIPVIKTRDIIYKNTAPVQLALKSLGVDLGDAKRKPLLSDFYTFDKSI